MGTSLYKSALLWFGEHTFSFHRRLKTAFPLLELEHQRCLAGTEQSRAELSSQRGLAHRPLCPMATSQLCSLSYAVLQQCCITKLTWTVSQLNCLHWIKFPSSLHPKLEIPVGTELVPVTIAWPVAGCWWDQCDHGLDFQATPPCLMTLLKGAHSLCSYGLAAFSHFFMSGFPVLPMVDDKQMG